MLLCVYEHAVQTVIIEDAVVDAFCGGALVIDLLISIRAAGDIGVKPSALSCLFAIEFPRLLSGFVKPEAKGLSCAAYGPHPDSHLYS